MTLNPHHERRGTMIVLDFHAIAGDAAQKIIEAVAAHDRVALEIHPGVTDQADIKVHDGFWSLPVATVPVRVVPMLDARTVLWVDETMATEGGFIPSVVTEGEPGHSPLRGNPARHQSPWVFGPTIADAQRQCDEHNAKRGIDREQAMLIVAESMALQNEQGDDDDDTGCPGHESLRGDHMGRDFYCDGSCQPKPGADALSTADSRAGGR